MQLEMKKVEIIKCLTSINKKDIGPYAKSQRQYGSSSRKEESQNPPRTSNDSDPAEGLSVSIATSVLLDDYPTVNYAAAVLRGRQTTIVAGLPATGINYSNGTSESGYWSSANASTVSSPALIVSSGGRMIIPPSSAPPISGISVSFAATAGKLFEFF